MLKITRCLVAMTLLAGLVISGCSSSPAPSIQASTDRMLNLTAELEQSIPTGDKVKLKGLGQALDETWTSYEQTVQDKSPELHDQVDAALTSTVAAAEADALDTKALAAHNDELIAALHDVQNLK
ncbi:MAG TPA: hypothetical protein VFV52_18005 [Bacilli bacterium]|nr:hypothetical protein [Bacilli bacterium]